MRRLTADFHHRRSRSPQRGDSSRSRPTVLWQLQSGRRRKPKWRLWSGAAGSPRQVVSLLSVCFCGAPCAPAVSVCLRYRAWMWGRPGCADSVGSPRSRAERFRPGSPCMEATVCVVFFFCGLGDCVWLGGLLVFEVFLFGSFFLCVSSFSLSVSLSFLFLFQGTPPSDAARGEGVRSGPLPPTL